MSHNALASRFDITHLTHLEGTCLATPREPAPRPPLLTGLCCSDVLLVAADLAQKVSSFCRQPRRDGRPTPGWPLVSVRAARRARSAAAYSWLAGRDSMGAGPDSVASNTASEACVTRCRMAKGGLSALLLQKLTSACSRYWKRLS